jgi:hypothetical protein
MPLNTQMVMPTLARGKRSLLRIMTGTAPGMQMIEKDIGKLDSKASQRSLEGLEADIWLEVETRRRATRLSTLILSCQAAVLVLGFVLSAVAGARFVTPHSSADALKLFSAESDLSPSARLGGF